VKKIEWRDPNHMKIETGHKTFDRQADLISTGNVIGHVQYSSYIRPYNETECNGLKFEKGHLRAFDLQWWIKTLRTPERVLNYVLSATTDKSVILYQFHHHGRLGRTIVDGHVVTTADHKLLASFRSDTPKSGAILKAVLPYITEAA
jgi:hypothetical protein